MTFIPKPTTKHYPHNPPLYPPLLLVGIPRESPLTMMTDLGDESSSRDIPAVNNLQDGIICKLGAIALSLTYFCITITIVGQIPTIITSQIT
jgi:hypothetical protein